MKINEKKEITKKKETKVKIKNQHGKMVSKNKKKRAGEGERARDCERKLRE